MTLENDVSRAWHLSPASPLRPPLLVLHTHSRRSLRRAGAGAGHSRCAGGETTPRFRGFALSGASTLINCAGPSGLVTRIGFAPLDRLIDLIDLPDFPLDAAARVHSTRYLYRGPVLAS